MLPDFETWWENYQERAGCTLRLDLKYVAQAAWDSQLSTCAAFAASNIMFKHVAERATDESFARLCARMSKRAVTIDVKEWPASTSECCSAKINGTECEHDEHDPCIECWGFNVVPPYTCSECGNTVGETGRVKDETDETK